ncbi:MAG: hypothetical protein K5770_10425 [Lachnospiraceae bacterium]|nr:hypothetical protein [Lachnospiraceae bacterium]
MIIRKKELFKTAAGDTVCSVTLCSDTKRGVLAEFISLGAGIRRLSYIEEGGNENLLTLSYKDFREYGKNSSLAGLTIGPNAGRIPAENGLSANEGRNQLHGGLHNLSSMVWQIEELSENRDFCEAVFCASQPDGLDGWPGNRSYRASYRLKEDGSLTISYFAETDRDTYINMTNHTYWLMNEASLKLNAGKICINREDFLPVDIGDIPQVIPGYKPGDDIPLSAPLNNGFILNRTGEKEKNEPDAVLKLFNGKFNVDMYTDAPAIVVYTGDYLDDKTELLDNTVSSPHSALALEAQDMPTVLPKVLTKPGSPFRRTIRFAIRPL